MTAERIRQDLDEIILRYTRDNWSLRKVASNFSLTRDALRSALIEAGVEIRSPGRQPGSTQPPPKPWTPAPGPSPALERAELEARCVRHCNAVIAALGGRGFPYGRRGARS